MEAKEKAKIICDVLSAKKAYDVLKIDVSEKTVLADYFIICSGKSSTQVRSLAEYAEEEIEKRGGEVRRKEGTDEGRWVVVDFGDVILHVFNDDTRLFTTSKGFGRTKKTPRKSTDFVRRYSSY